MTTDDQKATAAEEAYQDYDFGTLRVTDSEGWDTSDPLDHTVPALAAKIVEISFFPLIFALAAGAQIAVQNRKKIVGM